MRLWPRFALAVLLFACGSPRLTDAGDSARIDASADTSPRPSPPAHTCQACRYDTDCTGGGLCIEADPTKSAGIFSCVMPCEPAATAGSVCSGAPDTAATCTLLGLGMFCVPTVSTDPMVAPVCFTTRAGTTCTASSDCHGRYDTCGAWSSPSAMCLHRCTDDRDCDDGYRRCRDVRLAPTGESVRACVRDARIGPEACGVDAVDSTGLGAACATTGTACATGLTCLSGVDPAVTAFCTRSCASDADCGAAASCLTVTGHGSVCLPRDCSCIAGARDTLLDRALAQSSWTRCNLYWKSDAMAIFGRFVAQDRFRLPVFDRIHLDWLAGAAWPATVADGLDVHAATLSSMISSAQALARDGTATSGHTALPATALTDASPLAEATARLTEAFGGTADRAALATAAASVPLDLQRALSGVLVAITRAALARDRGLLHAPTPDDATHLFIAAPSLVLTFLGDALSPLVPMDQGAILGDVEIPVDEAIDLAATIESIDWAQWRDRPGVSFRSDTPLGAIIVGDAGPTAWTSARVSGNLVLLVDLGGDDTYEIPVGATASPENRVSVGIDLGGADRYGYALRTPADTADLPAFLPSDQAGRYHPRAGEMAGPMSKSNVGRQGSGRLGVGLLYDLGSGADQYRSLRMSQGFGSFGVGGLYDDGGDDTYAVEAAGQGSGIHGFGVLLDAGGNDQYLHWAFSCGFGYVRGVGVAYDSTGDDRYTADQHDVLYWSPQLPGISNSSMSQGTGFGRRADGTDNVNMSGGIGVLRDRVGRDSYTAGVFAEGTGYWGGMGLLLDGAGDDTYDGEWYTQGADAHFAYAALLDGGGHDVHANPTRRNMTLGAGHDFSLGVFIALGPENDEYHAPNLGLGAGNANGVGLFFEHGGDDLYDCVSDLSLGNASYEQLPDPVRDAPVRPTVGLFVDSLGTDSYQRPTAPPPANNALWTQRNHPNAPVGQNERGFGADDTSGRTGP